MLIPTWHRDGELAADIAPTHQAASAVGAALVTGATGFLGRHLLRELLARTSAPIYCLARSSEDGSAADRVSRALTEANAASPAAGARLRVLDADLSKPDFGLSSECYAAIASSVSMIVHCAANVSWSRSYSRLRDTNVLPVSHLLRLACTGARKHFAIISSMAVCYTADTGRYTNERTDPSEYFASIPLGYAQSKAVAERLVRQAAARGLGATIFRPALIAGHSSGGQINEKDFVAWFVSGCVTMGWAPDVDWRLDVVPVDFVAAVVGANLQQREGLRTFHIAHPEPRDWRELVLLLNLYGYRVRMEGFERWLDRLVSFPDRTLPLKRFIHFFRERLPGSRDLTVSQIYTAAGQSRISNSRSSAHLSGQGLVFPTLDAAYFGQYVLSLAEAGLLQRPSIGSPPRSRSVLIGESVIKALRPVSTTVAHKNLTGMRAARIEARGSITAELSSWRHGGNIGFYGISSNHAACPEADLILKISALDEEAISTAIEVAQVCDPHLGSLFRRFRDHLDFPGASERETAIYTNPIPGLTEYIPHCYAFGREPASGRCMLLLERLADAKLLNSVDRPDLWTDVYIKAAIRDLACIHAVGYGRPTDLPVAASPIRQVDAGEIIAAIELWIALFEFGMPLILQCGGRELAARIESIVFGVEGWLSPYALQPKTLIHNDCNPRNMAFKHNALGLSTCLYDWELCTVAPPQRDLAEFLSFTLDARDAADHARRYVELHRRELSQNTGQMIDVEQWNEGFRLALADLMLRRLPLYMMLHSHVRQTFLPRVIRSWQALDRAVQR